MTKPDNPQAELNNLRAQLGSLTRIRSEIVTRARNEIAAANADYDQRAIPIMRRITELTEQAGSNKRRKKSVPQPDPSWPQEVQRQFREAVQRGAANG